MLIGHLPAGYLAGTAALDRLGVPPHQRRALLAAALAASVAPDLDVVAFYAVGGDVHHHAYPTHWPLTWAALTSLGLTVAAGRGSRFLALASLFVGGAALLHLSLDSVAGAVRWGAPFSDHETTLVEVPARRGHWVASMVLHWTFAAELGLAAVALAAWRRSRPRALRRERAGAPPLHDRADGEA